MSELYVTKQIPTLQMNQELSIQIIKQIRKLRWIGLEDDTELLQQRLNDLQLATNSVLAEQDCKRLRIEASDLDSAR